MSIRLPSDLRFLLLVLIIGFSSGCASNPAPQKLNDLCALFEEKDDWYDAVRAAEKRYSISVPLIMAFIHQESRFIHNNRPAYRWFLGVIPLGRPSTAYGYAQALESTWNGYQKETGNWRASRDDFEDAVDFIGWYNRKTVSHSSIKPEDAYRLYLVYHEGLSGYSSGAWKNKEWLKAVALKVKQRTIKYKSQLKRCLPALDEEGFWQSL